MHVRSAPQHDTAALSIVASLRHRPRLCTVLHPRFPPDLP
jgi:hypothetical protein